MTLPPKSPDLCRFARQISPNLFTVFWPVATQARQRPGWAWFRELTSFRSFRQRTGPTLWKSLWSWDSENRIVQKTAGIVKDSGLPGGPWPKNQDSCRILALRCVCNVKVKSRSFNDKRPCECTIHRFTNEKPCCDPSGEVRATWKDYFCEAAHLNHRRSHRITQSVGKGTDGLILRHWHQVSVRCTSTELLPWARAVGLKHIVCTQPNRNIKAVGCNGADVITMVRTVLINLSNFLAMSNEAGKVEGNHHLPPKQDAKRKKESRPATRQGARRQRGGHHTATSRGFVGFIRGNTSNLFQNLN